MTSTSERRFVVLEHDTNPHHFDLMIESDEALWTWSLYRDQLPDSFEELAVERIQDHRTAYLTYEGPVSGDRGRVQRVDKGTCRLTEIHPETRFAGRFDGRLWTCPFQLQRTDRNGPREGPLWTLTNTEQNG